jgi:hypothetical protein
MPSGISCMESYHKKEEPGAAGTINENPVHDESSHGASAFRTMAEAHARGMLEGTTVVEQDSRRSHHGRHEAKTGLRSNHGNREPWRGGQARTGLRG